VFCITSGLRKPNGNWIGIGGDSSSLVGDMKDVEVSSLEDSVCVGFLRVGRF